MAAEQLDPIVTVVEDAPAEGHDELIVASVTSQDRAIALASHVAVVYEYFRLRHPKATDDHCRALTAIFFGSHPLVSLMVSDVKVE